uniref:MFS transporter n=1 Tax=Cyberlindnera americana TaxID=36016 RepID=A0A5P8N8L5_9ASCO|nr:MFS transporter [Cyberlindnera americana]
MTTDTERHFEDKFFESNAGDGTTVFDQYMTGLPLIMSFSACFITLFLIALDQTIVVTIFETVGIKFNAYDKIGWISSGYMLTMAVFAQTWGRFSIIFGRKYALSASIILFEAGSLLCALAPNMNTLIGGRVLAGIGGAGIETLVFVVGGEMFPINKRPLAYALLGCSFSISSVIGPIIGGALTENVSWRWCFYINLPFGGIAFIALTYWFNPPIPSFTLKEKLEQIDFMGTFLLTSGLVIFLLGLTFGGQEFPWKSVAVILCLILGGLILVIFCIWNFKYSKHQIIPYEIVKTKKVMFPVMNLFFCYYGFMGLIVYSSAFFQIVHGASPLSMGVQFFPFIIPTVIVSISVGILMKTTRYIKPYAIIGGIFGVVGYGTMSLLSENSKSPQKIGYLILPGASFGLLLQTAVMSCQLEAPKKEGSMILVTALFNFSRSLGGAVGSDLSQVIFNSSVKQKLLNKIKENPTIFESLETSSLMEMLNNPSLIESLPKDVKKIVIKCIMDSIRNLFYTSTGVLGLAFLTTVCYSNRRIPLQENMGTKEEMEANEELKT